MLQYAFFIVLALVTTATVYLNAHWEKSTSRDSSSPRYLPYNTRNFTLALGLVLVIYPQLLGWRVAALQLFQLVLWLSIYELALLLLLPLLRKVFSARACGMLYLLPDVILWGFFMFRFQSWPLPRFVISLPGRLLTAIAILWAVGAAAVLGYQLIRHFLFRSKIIGSASLVEEEEILAVWQAECDAAGLRESKLTLARSPLLETPLSIGFFWQQFWVVLPQKDYTREDLSLIFRHELIHIGRQDSDGKFVMTVFCALCWFNPFMWLAMRKSADDLELSCDETVLLNASQEDRRRYADLLLTTAGESRGFTTCLSGSAKALRYRLKNTVKPKKRLVGGVMAGVMVLVFSAGFGSVAVALSPEPGSQVLFPGAQENDYAHMSYTLSFTEEPQTQDDPSTWQFYQLTDQQAFLDLLSDLPMSLISQGYEQDVPEDCLTISFGDSSGDLTLNLYDRFVCVNYKHQSTMYYLQDPLPWSELFDLMVPAQP